MNCIVYTTNCNFVTHAICPLPLTMHKYSELKISNAIKKFSYKTNYKTPFFLIM